MSLFDTPPRTVLAVGYAAGEVRLMPGFVYWPVMPRQ